MYKETEYLRLRERLRFDPLDLDIEYGDNAALVTEVGEYTAEAIQRREVAENNVKIALADVASRLREAPTGGKAKSETQVASERDADPEVISARTALEDVKYDASMWLALAQGMRERSSGLDGIAKLVVAGYYTRDYFVSKRKQEVSEHRQEHNATRRALRSP